MENILGSLNSLLWILVAILIVAVVVWAVRTALAPTGGRAYREHTVVQQPPAPTGGLAPGWYPDQNDHRLVRYYDGRVWTSETRHQ